MKKSIVFSLLAGFMLLRAPWSSPEMPLCYSQVQQNGKGMNVCTYEGKKWVFPAIPPKFLL